MHIKIKKACEHNLKDVSVDIPIGKMTAITGVSGSGKSSLLKNVLAATGSRRYTSLRPKTVRSALAISNFINVESVEHLPITILIDTKSAISNARSTVSTVSGIHEILRDLFEESGECQCPYCHSRIDRHPIQRGRFLAELICDEKFDLALKAIREKGSTLNEAFYDKNKRLMTSRSRESMFAEIHFELPSVSDSWIRAFNKNFRSVVLVDCSKRYDPLTLVQCEMCKRIVPRLTRSRLSFNIPFQDGGAMCRHCHGTGISSMANVSDFIVDGKKSIVGGGIRYLTNKGLQFTQLNLSMLKIAAKACGIDVETRVQDISEDDFKKFLFGLDAPVVMNVGKGKKKAFAFKGVIGSLEESFIKGKGRSSLSKYFTAHTCPSCHGLRVDPEISGLLFHGRSLASFLSMTFEGLHDWCKEELQKSTKDIHGYIEQLSRKTGAFCRVACGHLSLDRSSNTLSGGELQRIRVCALLNANVNGVCYLLDEPSTGLHESDVESLGTLLKELCVSGNTVILVDHNKTLLTYCDQIIDLGPCGGEAGGRLLFSDSIENVRKYNTATARLLSEKKRVYHCAKKAVREFKGFLEFRRLAENNLKNVNVSFPSEAFTTVCGVSGSGKSTFLRDVLYNRISKAPTEFGFEDVIYLAQKTFSVSNSSLVATQLDAFRSLTRRFAAANSIPLEWFLPNSKFGKCPVCEGKGLLFSEADEFVGVCSKCGGRRYSDQILNTNCGAHTFGEVLDAPIASLGDILLESEWNSLSKTARLLGIGYLSLSRRANTLSRGEYQRLKLLNAVSKGVRNCLFLLDEPSRGLHSEDAANLLVAFRTLTQSENTIVAVEHNPFIVENSDYIVEFGGTGKSGGHLLYNGVASERCGAESAMSSFRARHDTIASLPLRKFQGSIVYRVNGEIRRYGENQTHHLSGTRAREIVELASATSSDFFSTAIPGSSYCPIVRNRGEEIIASPVVQHVDFKQKIKYEHTLYDLLGLKDHFVSSVISKHSDYSELLRYVFDDSSPTGKCSFCNGRGLALVVPEKLFLKDGDLSKSCRAFLHKSAGFTAFAKSLKQSRGIDVFASNGMEDKSVLTDVMYGNLDSSCKDDVFVRWPGVIQYFLRNHTLYSSEEAEGILAKKRLSVCPVCSGRMLLEKYVGFSQIKGLSYRDMMACEFATLVRKVHCGDDVHLKRIKETLEDLIHIGLGGLSGRMRIQDLSEIDSGLVALETMKRLGFSQLGIAISGIEKIPSAIAKEVAGLLECLRQSNTVFICH